MVKGAVTFVIGAVALAALAPAFVPSEATAPSEPPRLAAQDAPAGAPAQESRAERNTSGYREAEIAADAFGQYRADVLVGGMPVHMVIDTGASFVSVSASTAARLGLVPRPGPKWRMRTASGESLASPIKLDSLSFGGLYMRDVQAVILAPEAGDVNLLGASFLKRLVSVEQRDGILFLRQ